MDGQASPYDKKERKELRFASEILKSRGKELKFKHLRISEVRERTMFEGIRTRIFKHHRNSRSKGRGTKV